MDMKESITERDMENALLILEQIMRLQELGNYSGTDPTPSQQKFIALMLRNERAKNENH